MEIIEFFQGLEKDASRFFLIAVLASFLLGLIIALLLRGGRIRKLKRALKASEAELKKANSEINSLNEALKKSKDEVERLKYDLHEANVKAERLETERSRFYNEAFKLKEELKLANTTQQDQLGQIEVLKKEIADLKLLNEKLNSQIEVLENKLEAGDTETNGLAQMQSVFMATKQRLEAVEERLYKVEQENSILKEQVYSGNVGVMAGTSGSTSSTTIVDEVGSSTTSVLPSEIDAGVIEEEPVIKIHDEKPGLTRKIDVNEYDKDNLTLIDGVGPFLEKKLNDIGIVSFAQIASLSADDIPQLTRAIGHIPGRIEQDKWVEQAAKLLDSRLDNPVATVERTIDVIPTPDDLTVIEGIGPQLQDILKDAGINTWHDLAETDDEQLHAILLTAGPGYQIVDASSWPAQAQLAINGEWDLLREYREELNED